MNHSSFRAECIKKTPECPTRQLQGGSERHEVPGRDWLQVALGALIIAHLRRQQVELGVQRADGEAVRQGQQPVAHGREVEKGAPRREVLALAPHADDVLVRPAAKFSPVHEEPDLDFPAGRGLRL